MLLIKSLMTVLEFVTYFGNKYPEYLPYVKNGNIDQSKEKAIDISLAPNTRRGFKLDLGGLESTEVSFIPINILIHWTADYNQCNGVANKILLELQQVKDVLVGKRKINCILSLDTVPNDLGRINNYCEMLLRFDVAYKLEEEAINV